MTKRMLPGDDNKEGPDGDDDNKHPPKRVKPDGDEEDVSSNVENNKKKKRDWLAPPTSVRHPRIGTNYQANLPAREQSQLNEKKMDTPTDDSATAPETTETGNTPSVSQEDEEQQEHGNDSKVEEPDAAAGDKDHHAGDGAS